jgi:hypothetical protein
MKELKKLKLFKIKLNKYFKKKQKFRRRESNPGLLGESQKS